MAAFLFDKTNEFAKLDEIDRHLCLEIMENNPRALKAWIDHVTDEYQRKDSSFSGEKLRIEIKHFQEYITRADNDFSDAQG